MSAWLYQMTAGPDWSLERYRVRIWEGKRITWPTGRVARGSAGNIDGGQLLVLCFSKTGSEDPGVYGYGIVLSPPRGDRFSFRVVPPSDRLKADPAWNPGVEEWLDKVRGPVRQGTMWALNHEELTDIRQLVREHLAGAG